MSERSFRGRIDALLSEDVGSSPGLERWLAPTAETRVEQIPVDRIADRPWRGVVDVTEPSFRALKSSIRASGVLKPLLLRPLSDGGYEVVSGARRLRAARDTAQGTVPAQVRQLSDAEALIGGAWEALLRTGVDAEEADALSSRLVDGGMLSDDAIALVGSLPRRASRGAAVEVPEAEAVEAPEAEAVEAPEAEAVEAPEAEAPEVPEAASRQPIVIPILPPADLDDPAAAATVHGPPVTAPEAGALTDEVAAAPEDGKGLDEPRGEPTAFAPPSEPAVAVPAPPPPPRPKVVPEIHRFPWETDAPRATASAAEPSGSGGTEAPTAVREAPPAPAEPQTAPAPAWADAAVSPPPWASAAGAGTPARREVPVRGPIWFTPYAVGIAVGALVFLILAIAQGEAGKPLVAAVVVLFIALVATMASLVAARRRL